MALLYFVEHRFAHNALVRLNSTSLHICQALLQSVDPINWTTVCARIKAILTLFWTKQDNRTWQHRMPRTRDSVPATQQLTQALMGGIGWIFDERCSSADWYQRIWHAGECLRVCWRSRSSLSLSVPPSLSFSLYIYMYASFPFCAGRWLVSAYAPPLLHVCATGNVLYSVGPPVKQIEPYVRLSSTFWRKDNGILQISYRCL